MVPFLAEIVHCFVLWHIFCVFPFEQGASTLISATEMPPQRCPQKSARERDSCPQQIHCTGLTGLKICILHTVASLLLLRNAGLKICLFVATREDAHLGLNHPLPLGHTNSQLFQARRSLSLLSIHLVGKILLSQNSPNSSFFVTKELNWNNVNLSILISLSPIFCLSLSWPQAFEQGLFLLPDQFSGSPRPE